MSPLVSVWPRMAAGFDSLFWPASSRHFSQNPPLTQPFNLAEANAVPVAASSFSIPVAAPAFQAMDTQLDALPTLPVLARTVSDCVNSAFLNISQHFTAHLFRPWILSSARGIDSGPRRFNRPGRLCALEASRESTMTDDPTRCGRTERISITDRRIPRSWSKTDWVPERTSDLEHGQRASLETGRGWRAKSARHGRKPPPDGRRIFRATRFVSRRKTSANVRETGGTADRRASKRVVNRLSRASHPTRHEPDVLDLG